ncbi:MAG: tetratricopeptide repeat protein [bacterium]|nr:tetratricopeptide repeat protein [bacterium]
MIRSVTGLRAGRAAALIAVLIVSAAWFAAWRVLDRTPLSRVPVLDEAHYLREGAAVAGGRLVPERPSVMSPLYPYLVAATGGGRELDTHRVRTGPPPWGLRVAQFAMWLGTAWLLLREGRRLLPPAVGWLPALLWLLYRPGAVLAGSALLEVPLTFLATLGLSTAVAADARANLRASRRRAVLAGACLGLAALLRGTALLLLVPAVLSLGGAGRPPPAGDGPRRGAADDAALRAVQHRTPGPAVGSEPQRRHQPLHRQRRRSQRDVPDLPRPGRRGRSGRATFSVGAARPDAGRRGSRRPGLGRRGLARRAGASLHAVGLWWRKLRLHLVAAEIPQISPHAAWTREAPILGLFCVPYWLLAAGGLAGAALALRREPRLRPWALGLLLIVAVQSLFFVVSRYRLVLVPGLALLTGAAAAVLLRSRGRALAVAGAVVVAAVLAVQPWGLGGQFARLEAAGDLNEAVRWSRLADAREASAAVAGETGPERRRAEALFRAATARDPAHPEAWCGLANSLLQSGRDAEALACLREGAARAAPAGDVRRDFVALALRLDDAAGALPVLLHLLREAPRDPDLLHQSVIALSRTGRAAEAEEHARRLAAVAPEDPRGWQDLGVVLARARRFPEARAAFAEGLRRRPDHAGLRGQQARLDSLTASR